MSETKNPGDSTLGVPSKNKTLTLKRSGSFDKGSMRQSVGQGRSKSAVVVEKKRRRIVKPGAAAEVSETPRAPRQQPQAKAEGKPRAVEPRQDEKKTDAKGRTGVVLRTLTDEERGARAAALAEARVREQEERRIAEERAVVESREAERRALEAEEAERRRVEEEARRQTEIKVREKSEREARERLDEPAPASAPTPPAAASSPPKPSAGAPAPRPSRGREVSLEEASREAERLKRAKPADQKSPKRGDDRRRGKLTVTTALSDDGAEERGRSLAAMRRRREREKRQLSDSGPREKIVREVVLPETITIQELANRMAERAVDVIKLLMKQGQMLKINDVIDADTAELIASEMGHTVKRVSEADVEEGLFGEPDTDEEGQPRPPVVTIMGHVDHGKTSLLDALREANVVSGEAGGITQHIGAYQVEHEGAKTTFIDTPGHEAFTAMRARGARVTDIVILVVAADDSVMPQTVEAINHAKAAEVPMIVAINKMDKPEADPQKVRTELLQHEVVVESMSGDVQDVEVSALKKQGLNDLLEAIALQAEILELKANPDRPAEGVVIEAKLDKGRGPVGTVLVQRGTLRKGDIIVAGNQWAKVRALIDDRGNTVEDAPPATPVEVLGFTGAPAAGDRFAVVETEARAREITEYRQRQEREKAVATGAGARGSLEQMMSQLRESGRAEFPLVIKSDVQGSAEAIAQALEKLNTDEVAARILMSGVGGITESDVSLAATSNAAIIGFNVRANKQAREASDQEGIEIRYYNVIYDLVDDIKQAMSGLLAPEQRETFLGNAEILQIFKVSKVGSVAGCRVTEGVVERGARVRLIRDNVVIHEGELSQLKRFKDDANQVVAGQECGMAFANYQDMREGDVIECYRVEEIARTL